MKAKREVELVVDSKENVFVKSHQGKLQLDGSTKPLKGQQGVACTIASRERLRTFYTKDAEKSADPVVRRNREAQVILNKVKAVMASQPLDFDDLLSETMRGLEKMSYDPLTEIFKNPAFIGKKTELAQSGQPISAIKFYNMAGADFQAKWAFFTLMDKMDQTFGLKNLEWTIEDGFEGLQQALRDNGQIIFQGKYGICFHGGSNVAKHRNESTVEREVYFFKPRTLHASSWTHCVIVDQAKIIDGKPFIFFRDPYDPSTPGAPEKAYMLSYDSFIQRISDKYGNIGGPKATYGLALEQEQAKDVKEVDSLVRLMSNVSI
ncbi:hypothetical protein [Legionella sp.]|uniref:hypothetical protein n=1 Tax=Legionella sp. TaxID=459 RepID=UPI000CC567BA|nr:hypothetical protein [Legionella sp.]PJE11477.1 MAG: hypothetical protein CK430_08735 [Legionella sp.]